MAMDEGRDMKDAARGAQGVGLGVGASARQQLSTFVADRVREQIVRGGLPSGRFLRVEALAHELGMSTTPVREGLLLLCSEAFVRLIPRRGFVVNGFTSSDLRDVYWAQATLAAELAERAARDMSALDVERLEVVHDRHELAMDQGDRARAAASGRQFHRLLNRAARAPRLALLLGNLAQQLPGNCCLHLDGLMEDAVHDHQRILQAVAARDVQAVRSLMFDHLARNAEHLIAALDRQGRWTQ